MMLQQLALLSLVPSAAGSWHYGPTTEDFLGPDDWHQEYPVCAAKEQSPINLEGLATQVSTELEPLQFQDRGDEPVCSLSKVSRS